MSIKVGEASQFDTGRPLQIGQGTPDAPVDPVAFQKQLAYHHSLPGQEPLDRLVGQIDDQAKKLLNNPSLSLVAAYRDIIRRFLKAVSGRLGKLETRTDRRNRTLVVIRNLDQKLDDLTRSILDGQEKGLDLLERLNEIRGMLLDLLI